MKEIIICAAVITEDDRIIRCHRHCDGIEAASKKRTKVKQDSKSQGFITSTGRYVDREEAHLIHFGKVGKLFSEDVY